MSIISFIQQKGGTAKTTTTANIGCALALKGQSILLVDLDPQGAQSTAFGYKPDELETTIYDVFFNSVKVESAIIYMKDVQNIHLLPSNLQLAEGEFRMISEIGRESFLKRALDPIKNKYDYILIDSPPSLSMLSTNALVASDYVIIPVAPDVLSLRGMENLVQYIVRVKEVLNPGLGILGIVINLFDNRTLHAKESKQALIEEFGNQIRIFKTDIMYTTKVKDSYAAKKPVVLYYPDSKVAKQYISLAEEVKNVII